MTHEERAAQIIEDERMANIAGHPYSTEYAIRAALLAVERETRAATLAECAEMADTETELPGDPPAEIMSLFPGADKDHVAILFRSFVRATKDGIARRIRALSPQPASAELEGGTKDA